MNGLNWDGNTFVMDSDQNRIGIGVAHPETKLHVKAGSAGTVTAVDGTVLILESNEKPKIQFQSPGAYGGSIVFASPTDNDEGQIDYDHGSDRFLFKTGGGTKMSILGNNVGVGTAAPERKFHVVGDTIITSNLGVTGTITGGQVTDGTVTMTGGNISSVNTLTATSVNATITKAAQTNITSVGTLTGLTISGDLNVDSNALFVNSTTNKVGLGYNNPVKTLEVSSSAEQLRLTYQRNVGIGYADKHTDIYTNSDGYLLLSASHERVGINVVSPTVTLEVGGDTKINGGLKVTGLALGAGVTTKYLALDSGNNIVLTSSVAPGIETRNRRKITGNTSLAEDDYYIGVSSSSNVVVTLPNASVLSNGQTFTIKDERGNAGDIQLKITASAEQLIDGQPLIFIESAYGSVNLYTDGSSNYFIF